MWRLTIGTNHYYLTAEEKDFYMACLSRGEQYAQMKDKILSTRFMDLVSTDTIDSTELMDKGKWKCDFGYWHEKGVSCNHANKYELDEVNKKYVLVSSDKLAVR